MTVKLLAQQAYKRLHKTRELKLQVLPRILRLMLILLALANQAVFASTEATTTRQGNTSPLIETTIITGTPSHHASNTLTASLSKLDTAEHTAVHPHKLLQAVPGTWISRGSGQEHLTAIRSPVFTGAGACGAFTITQQGIPLRAQGFCNTNQLFDSHYEAADSVEVIRGPNGVALGNNALFGGINIQLPQPESNHHQKVRLSTGSHDFYQIHADINATAQQQGYRILATADHNNSFRDNAGYTQQKITLLSSHSLNAWSVLNTLSANHLEQDTAGFIYGEEAYKNEDIRNTNANPEAFRDVASLRASSQWSNQHSSGLLKITPYARWSQMAFLQHFLPWQSQEENSQRSIGIRLTSQNQIHDRWDALRGIDSDVTQGSLIETQANESPFAPAQIPVGTHYDYTVTALNAALFGNIYYRASPQLRFDFGLRADYQQYRYNNHLSDGSACAEGVNNCRFFRPQDAKDTFKDTALKVSTLYSINKNVNTYLTFANGFRHPQATELYRLQAGQSSADLRSVNVRSWEMGLRFDNSQLSSEFNIFMMNQKDGIFQNSERYNVNGLSSSHRGVEITNTLTINNHWLWIINGHYAEHRYRNNPRFSAGTLDIKNNLYDTAPKIQLSNGLRFSHNKSEVNLYIHHLGKYFTNENNSHSYPGHTTADFDMAHHWTSTFSTILGIENITDKLYADRANHAFGEPRYFPADRRRVFITLQLSHTKNP